MTQEMGRVTLSLVEFSCGENNVTLGAQGVKSEYDVRLKD